jgi:hypothetical protein
MNGGVISRFDLPVIGKVRRTVSGLLVCTAMSLVVLCVGVVG